MLEVSEGKRSYRADMLSVDPPKAVLVHRDGVSHTGSLEAWRRDEVGWLGYVRYSVVGMRHLEWVAVDRLTPNLSRRHIA